MIQALKEPLKPVQAALLIAGTVAAVAAYCLAYTALAGGSETLGEALLWAVVNILPWIAAFELAKRAATLPAKSATLLGALGFSLGAGLLLGGGDFLFELVRRVPALLATAGLLGIGMLLGARKYPQAAALPLAPAQVDWVAAAGNYVELHSAGRIVLHRAPLSQVEAELARHGFVRVHRSTLVRRDRIARVRPLDVILADGTSLRTGSRYRSALRG